MLHMYLRRVSEREREREDGREIVKIVSFNKIPGFFTEGTARAVSLCFTSPAIYGSCV